MAARDRPLLQIASWASRRSGQIWTGVLKGVVLRRVGKALRAVWMVRVMGDMRIRSGVLFCGRVIWLVVEWPRGVRGASGYG